MIWTSYNGWFVWRRWLQTSKSYDAIVLTLTEPIQLSGVKSQGLTQTQGRLLAWLRQIGRTASIIHWWSTRGNVPREAHASGLQNFALNSKLLSLKTTTLSQMLKAILFEHEAVRLARGFVKGYWGWTTPQGVTYWFFQPAAGCLCPT